MPRSSAYWITAVEAASSLGYIADIDMQPNPMAETSIPLLPRVRISTAFRSTIAFTPRAFFPFPYD
jgi:hypothetical protein